MYESIHQAPNMMMIFLSKYIITKILKISWNKLWLFSKSINLVLLKQGFDETQCYKSNMIKRVYLPAVYSFFEAWGVLFYISSNVSYYTVMDQFGLWSLILLSCWSICKIGVGSGSMTSKVFSILQYAMIFIFPN